MCTKMCTYTHTHRHTTLCGSEAPNSPPGTSPKRYLPLFIVQTSMVFLLQYHSHKLDEEQTTLLNQDTVATEKPQAVVLMRVHQTSSMGRRKQEVGKQPPATTLYEDKSFYTHLRVWPTNIIEIFKIILTF